MKLTKIGTYKDSILGANYDLVTVNAKVLSDYLKESLKSKGIKYDLFNSDRLTDKNRYRFEKHELDTVKNPPSEIYEYQNFFLLDKGNEYLLLDGFRRLLWYNAPSVDINVRVYKESNLSNKDILSLLVNLNHFKFYSAGSAYFDRGFALLLRTVFGLTISDYSGAFDGYLSSSALKNDYCIFDSDSTQKNTSVKERIVNDHFIDDIRFMEKLYKGGAMMNVFLGSTLYAHRLKTKTLFDGDRFLQMCKDNMPLKQLMLKYEKVGCRDSAESFKVVNPILEIYNNFFTALSGGELKKSYSDILAECKEEMETFRKNKEWTKITGSNFTKELEAVMKERSKNSMPILFKCMIYPTNPEGRNSDNKGYLEPGMHDNIVMKGWIKKQYGLGGGFYYEPVIGLDLKKEKGGDFRVGHNTGVNNWSINTTKKYAWIANGDHAFVRDSETYEIDLFINISKKELEAAKAAKK